MDDIIQSIQDALKEIDEFSQPRSDFALRHFVVGQHDLPARQRWQVLNELQTLLYAIFDLHDKRELAEIEIDELAAGDNASDFEKRRQSVRFKQLRREIWNIDYALQGREKEAATLLRILNALPRCTREEFEAQEAEYWRRRLTRQYIENQLGGGGNVSALAQMLSAPGEAMRELPGQNDLINKLLTGDKR